MPETDLVIIEGNHHETELIREEVVSPFKFDNVYEYETTEEFRQDKGDLNDIDLIVSDLLEHYEDGMSKEKVYSQLKNAFDRLLTSKNDEQFGIIFLTKVPSNYIKKAMKRSSDKFPHSEDGIEESFKIGNTIMYNAGKIGIATKPFNVDSETGEIEWFDEGTIKEIWHYIDEKFEIPTSRSL